MLIRRSTRMARACLVFVWVSACARPTVPSPDHATPATSASAVSPDQNDAPHALGVHWVPRVAPSPLRFGMPRQIYAPVQNNEGTRATAYLGQRRVGLLAAGRRWIFENDKISASADKTLPPVDAVLAIAAGLGGGFLFGGPEGLYFADKFDGPARKLAGDPSTYAGLAPHAVLVRGRGWMATRDGSSLAGAPREADDVFAHRRGFALTRSTALPGKTWFTSDGTIWREVQVGEVREAVEDGDALLLFTNSTIFRVTADGRPIAHTLTADEALQKRLGGALPADMPDRWGVEDGFEGALIDAGWHPTGRSDDEWFGVKNDQMFLTRTRTHETRPLGQKIGRPDESCMTVAVASKPLLTCLSLGTRFSVFEVDLAIGALRLERTIDVKRGLARRMGDWPGAFPSTLMVTATCDGDAEGGVCVRDERGVWSSFPLPRHADLLVFPGELIVQSFGPAGDLELRGPGSRRKRFGAEEMKRVGDAIGLKATAGMPAVVSNGVLRTAAGIRWFYGPSPFEPVTKAESDAVDLPLDPSASPSITRVEGVVATAGTHALRLALGKLWETDDGWSTWHEVEPPPTGVPPDLAGAMCHEFGCLLDGWARIGWQKSNAKK